jgi:hypothetical protein
MHKTADTVSIHERNAIFAFVLAFCQTILFVALHHYLIAWAIAMGHPDYVRGGFGWGILINFSVYVFAAICWISGFLAATFSRKYRIFFPLIGFVIFSGLFVDHLFHLTSFGYPKRALLLISCAFVTLVIPHLIFQVVTRFGWTGRHRWVCF